MHCSLFTLLYYYCTHIYYYRYNGRPLSGARVTTCWLDQKNMSDLGITEDMVYGDSVKSKADSYGRTGGKKLWTGKYRRRFNARERGSSSLIRYDRQLSRSPSPRGYNIQSSTNMESTSSLQLSDVSESQRCLSPSGYSLRSGDSQERPSSQTSDHSSQSGVRDESSEKSLSQTSRPGSRNSTSDRKRTASDVRSLTSNRFCGRKHHESDSDDTSSRERDSSRRSRPTAKHDSRSGKYSSRYSKKRDEHTSRRTLGPLTDKNSESDFKDRDREDEGIEERRQYRSRRSRESPRRTAKERSDDERQPKQEESSESDGQMMLKSRVPGRQSLSELPVQAQTSQEDSIPMTAEVMLDGTCSQVQPMDLDTSDNGSPEPGETIQIPEPSTKSEVGQPEPQVKTEKDSHDMESYVDAQPEDLYGSSQSGPQTRADTLPSTVPLGVFEFERDETPPAEIVEATAEWYRTQNIPDSISLQHMLQYYQQSMAAKGTKIEMGRWRDSVWPTASFHQGDQQQTQTATVDSPFTLVTVTSANQPTPTCSWNESIVPSTTKKHSTAVEPPLNPLSTTADISEEANDTSFPIVQLGAPSGQLTSHLSSDKKGSQELSDSEVQQQLQEFLNKTKSRGEGYSEPVLKSHPSARGEVSSFSIVDYGHVQNSNVERSSKQIGSSSYPEMELRERSIYGIPHNRDRSHSGTDSLRGPGVHHPAHYSQTSFSTFSYERAYSALNYPSTLDQRATVADHWSNLGESYELRPAQTGGHWKESERNEEHFRDGSRGVDEIWSREHNIVQRRERRIESLERMEVSDSRFKESDPSWGGEVRRQNQEVTATPSLAVTDLRFSNQPSLSPSLSSEQQLTFSHKKGLQKSEWKYSSPSHLRDHQFQEYTPSNEQSTSSPLLEVSHTKTGEHEHRYLTEVDCNAAGVTHESFDVFHKRIVDKLQASRNQSDQGQLQRGLTDELVERALNEGTARTMGKGQSTKESLEKDKPTSAYTSLGKEVTCSTTVEPSSDAQNADMDDTSLLRAIEENERATIPATNKLHVAHKYKHLQKSYYKVNASPQS